ncbi:Uma2 family endonuclease [Nodosilinea sp. LEGE 07088]|uniref:Uma2 family endonuclease n=1 Tax=Nodosilinea sp. LEGE 07088 TaxID=2777968 RepID=UPI00187E5729|nr:Uma2 family endonuclease [Nodosilinea sp. LEGE 07088]MBE9141380.1 Uma2 family endonuclease [Nodosilinea sp. LEGE 07088]
MALYPPTSELFDNWINNKPESKLELIDGQLVVGNSLTGSRLLLRQILQGWRADAAVALAPTETWFQAIAAGYDLTLPQTDSYLEILNHLGDQLADVEFVAEDLQAGRAEITWAHHRIQQQLTMDSFRLANQVGCESLGRDFVMRLGDNGFTPDLIVYKSQGLNQLFSYFLSGPAELVIEILMPGHKAADRSTKFDYYQAAGVPDYWLVDSESQQVEFYRLVDSQYQRHQPDSDGHYRPSSIPGLAFRPDALWQEDEDYNPLEPKTFKVEQSVEGLQRSQAEAGPQWGSLLFIPNIQPSPVPISFEAYISWCPRAKFEFIAGKPLINSTPGTRNVLAMLLMTIGLESAVKLLPPQAWIEGLRQRLEWEQHDGERKAEWWRLARQAAERLRTHFDLGRLGVIGDLTMPQPLNYWSDITLVYWEKFEESWKAFDVLRDIDPDFRIDLLEFQPEWLTADQLWQIERHLVEL